MFDAILHNFADLHYTRELGGYRRLRMMDANGQIRAVPDYVVVGDIDEDFEPVVVGDIERLRQIERRQVEFEPPVDPGLYTRCIIDEDRDHWSVERFTQKSSVDNLCTFHLKRTKPRRVRAARVER